ncbi:hypothetical protein PVL29_014496 [Vitis rotundifolia]|uniref:Major facilitator superfamily (MFS) profile domain-containing protein n=1 Tax=Vitis rotundifolia TaxID=103349 RepID=A0AA38ZGY8_VITRO|nr:hypothetical protein PVL29_014496 [Vitis rotundifolia]
MTVGGLPLPETPNSLIERGSRVKGRKVLERIRGTKEVDAEFENIVDASERNRPQLVMAICMPAFQILNCINSILFYAPVLFQALGFGNASLYSSALTGAVLVLSILVSIALVDKLGRRVLLISGGIQMFISDGCRNPGDKFSGNDKLSKGYSVLICLFVMAFEWWRWPLGRTVPSEIFPLETRSAGQSIRVAVNLLFAFIMTQSFLSLLCFIKYGVFLFFAGWGPDHSLVNHFEKLLQKK